MGNHRETVTSLQELYRRNRAPEINDGPYQSISKPFFTVWQQKGLIKALQWLRDECRQNNQGLPAELIALIHVATGTFLSAGGRYHRDRVANEARPLTTPITPFMFALYWLLIPLSLDGHGSRVEGAGYLGNPANPDGTVEYTMSGEQYKEYEKNKKPEDSCVADTIARGGRGGEIYVDRK